MPLRVTNSPTENAGFEAEYYPLTPSLLRVIEAQMRLRDIAPKQLGTSGSLRRTYYRWKARERNGNWSGRQRPRVRRSELMAYSEILDIPFRALAAACVADFEHLERIAHEVDSGLLKFIRSAGELNVQELGIAYRALLAGLLQQRGMNVQVFQLLLDNLAIAGPKALPKPVLRIDIQDELASLTFTVSGSAPLVVPQPDLLWDCCCRDPKRHTRRCKIHRSPSSPAVTTAFRNAHVAVTWRGLQLLWRNRKQLWPPSIDALRMLDALQRLQVGTGVRSILDIGSGTGVLGLGIASSAGESQNPRTLDLSDWLLSPALYGAANGVFNEHRLKNWRVRARIGMMTRWDDQAAREGEAYDLAVCNPPYLPVFSQFKSLGQHTAVAGTDLLEFAIGHLPQLAGAAYIQYSSVGDREARIAARAFGCTLRRVGRDREVPFRVAVAIARPKYVETLIKRRGVARHTGRTHRLWHKLRLRRVHGSGYHERPPG